MCHCLYSLFFTPYSLLLAQNIPIVNYLQFHKNSILYSVILYNIDTPGLYEQNQK